MKIPTDYETGYKTASALDPEMACNYVAHTMVGDPEADYVVERLLSLEPEEAELLIQAGMNNDRDALRDAPSYVRDFFKGIEDPPDWVDHSEFYPGIRMFHRNSKLVLGAFRGILHEHRHILLHYRTVERSGSQKAQAEQPPNGGNIHAGRIGQAGRWMEVVCKGPAGPRSSQTPAE